jgi:hypothetical protein
MEMAESLGSMVQRRELPGTSSTITNRSEERCLNPQKVSSKGGHRKSKQQLEKRKRKPSLGNDNLLTLAFDLSLVNEDIASTLVWLDLPTVSFGR